MYKNLLKPSALFIAVNAVLFTTSVLAEDTPTATLPNITITATTEKAHGPVEGLAASRVSSTTGTDESILKSTQSVSVIGHQELGTIGAHNMQQAFDYTAGVTSAGGASGGHLADSGYIIRGFESSAGYRDGQKLQANIFDGEQELYGLERIEIVKGADSLLNGEMPPGGMVNAVTKRPKFEDSAEVNAEIGSFKRKVVSADINKAVSDTVAMRLVGLYQDSDTFVNHAHDDRTYISPSVSWQPNDSTKVDVIASYETESNEYFWGFLRKGTIEPSPHGKIKRGTFYGVPGADKHDTERTTIGYDITHKFTPNLTVKHNFSKMNAKMDLDFYDYDEQVDDTPIFTRYGRIRDEKNDRTSSGISAQYDWSLGQNIDNITITGVDYSKTNIDAHKFKVDVNDINLFNPDHSKDKIDWSTLRPHRHTNSATAQQGVYLQNQLTYNDKLVALAGVRHTKYEEEYVNFSKPENNLLQDTSATTGRAGLVYLMENGIAPYASVNQSFELTEGTDKQGNRFKPTEGIQYETGVRYQPEGSDTLLSAAVFRIDQSNILTDDPTDDDYEVQLGKVRSQGLELEAKTQIGDNANLIAAYSYTDARVIESSPTTPEDVGERPYLVPYNAFSILGNYRFIDYNLPQLKAGLGVRYVGDTDMHRDYKSPSYTLVDLMGSYDFSDNITLSLNVKNLFDNDTLVCTSYCNFIEPRNMKAKLSYKW